MVPVKVLKSMLKSGLIRFEPPPIGPCQPLTRKRSPSARPVDTGACREGGASLPPPFLAAVAVGLEHSRRGPSYSWCERAEGDCSLPETCASGSICRTTVEVRP